MAHRDHWETIYQTRLASEVSWYQPEARISRDLIARVAPELGAAILDVGGGASTLVDGLLDTGYRHVTVLDLSCSALAAARRRLEGRAAQVCWIESDVLTAPLPPAAYDVWHDRAAFHFLTDPSDRARYVGKVREAIRPGGHVIVASFALDGPQRCSGLEVMRFSPIAMHAEFGEGFCLVDSVREDHHTPDGATQAFMYCLCRVDIA